MDCHPRCKEPESNCLRPNRTQKDCQGCFLGPYRSPGCIFYSEHIELNFKLIDYSDESLVEAVVAVWLATGRSPVREDFLGHKGGLPSYTTLRKRLGGIQAARRLALAKLQERGLADTVDVTLPRKGRKRGY
jgi:hypothetical protein